MLATVKCTALALLAIHSVNAFRLPYGLHDLSLRGGDHKRDDHDTVARALKQWDPKAQSPARRNHGSASPSKTYPLPPTAFTPTIPATTSMFTPSKSSMFTPNPPTMFTPSSHSMFTPFSPTPDDPATVITPTTHKYNPSHKPSHRPSNKYIPGHVPAGSQNIAGKYALHGQAAANVCHTTQIAGGEITACPLTDGSGWDCINTDSSLESCGGCASIGEGIDCTALPNVAAVGCNKGVCVIGLCDQGYTLVNGVCKAN